MCSVILDHMEATEATTETDPATVGGQVSTGDDGAGTAAEATTAPPPSMLDGYVPV